MTDDSPNHAVSELGGFAVKLLHKHCDAVNEGLLGSMYANPESLIVISLLAPVAYAALKMLQHLVRLYQQTLQLLQEHATWCIQSVASAVGNAMGAVLSWITLVDIICIVVVVIRGSLVSIVRGGHRRVATAP